MKKSKVAVPLPAKVVFQHRLVAAAILGLLVVGVIYYPPATVDVQLAPRASPTPPNVCSIANCHDSCASDSERISCNCKTGFACSCTPPQYMCDTFQGEACRINPQNGDAFCERPSDPPADYYCCACSMSPEDYEWYYNACPVGCTSVGTEQYPGPCGAKDTSGNS